MSPFELRASVSLASLFALRMLGLFLILPVFAIHAQENLPGGQNATLVGLALGIYGLTQGLLQIPFGMASDRFGRKPVIVFGLIVFAIGSFVAAAATDIYGVVIGRALQGAGAISAAVVAFIADLTQPENRTKAMAMVGSSIGLMFALSLAGAPALYRVIGMDGLFIMTGVLALLGVLVTWKAVPRQPGTAGDPNRQVRMATLVEVLRDRELLRLNFGIFALHAIQIALFVIVPVALVRHAGLSVDQHWRIYLPVVIVSFVLMVPAIIAAERRGQMKSVFLGAVAALAIVQAGFALVGTSLAAISLWLLVFFVAFNVLEAILPSLISKLAPAAARGTAIGVYNTTQALGIAAGGPLAGWLLGRYGEASVFVFGFMLVALWFVVALPMQPPAKTAAAAAR
jgi:MFS family permease